MKIQFLLFVSLFCFGGSVLWPSGIDTHGSATLRKRRDIAAAENVGDESDALEIIPKKYNINVPPPTVNGSATLAQLAVLIVNVRDIKDLSEELTLEINFKLWWKDERLKHLGDWAKAHNESFIVLHPNTIQNLWLPDIYIDHVKTIMLPTIVSKPESLRVYVDSTLRYSARLTLAQSCQMDFHYYPADTQRCSVDFMSYAYNDAKLNLSWKGGGRGASLVNKFTMSNFDVGLDNPEHFYIATTSGRYVGLRFTLILRRKLSSHLLQTFFPSTLFVFVSWQSFLVPVDSAPERMALCMTMLLTLTAMFSSVIQNIPVVSYIKAIDVWMVSMIIFVFLTLLENTTILKLKSLKARLSSRPKPNKNALDFQMHRIGADVKTAKSPFEAKLSLAANQSVSSISLMPADKTEANGLDWSPPSEAESSTSELSRFQPEKIEAITRMMIPSIFLIFQVVYWPWLLHKSKYYSQFNGTVHYSAL